MNKFSLKDSSEYYLQLSQQPVRFEPSSSVTNIFFDDTNGQVFTVRSGGVTGVTVNGIDPKFKTSFTMADKGPIISIKFSPDQSVLAIQRNRENQNATVEFINFKDGAPTNIEYHHVCKWKNANILGFVWPKNHEIAFVTDHGIELLLVVPEKKLLKSLKNTSFSAAWFSWCAQSKIVLLASNNGSLMQPFSLNGSTISKLQKLDYASKPILERDMSILRVNNTTWCALIRHGCSVSGSGPAELYLTPLTGQSGANNVHILKTGLVGRFAVNVVDQLIVVHHQASQTSQLFDIMEKAKVENGTSIHVPLIEAHTLKPCYVDDQLYPLYSGHWVVQQPDYMIDVRSGCLWQVILNTSGLAYELCKDQIAKIVAVLLRRRDGKETIYKILNQLVSDGGTYLLELSHVFDEINSVYRIWADEEVVKNTGQSVSQTGSVNKYTNSYVVISQPDMYTHVLLLHTDGPYIVQVITAYIASLCKFDLTVQHSVAEMCATTLVKRGQCHRLRQCISHGCLGDSRALACLLLSLGNVEASAAQLATDMLWRLKAYEEIVEVLIHWGSSLGAAGVARSVGLLWSVVRPRKLLGPTMIDQPQAFVALYHLLLNSNQHHGLTGEQCEMYLKHYKKIMSE